MDTPKDGTANDADALDRKLWGEDGPYPPDDGELFDYRGKTRGEEDRDSTQMVAYYVVLPLLVGIILGLGLHRACAVHRRLRCQGKLLA